MNGVVSLLSQQPVTTMTNVMTTADDDASGSATAATSLAVPVHDVQFDEHGQTWDVYGAEFDPEILGQAIQAHLERIMIRHPHSTVESQPNDCVLTSCDDVIPTSQSQVTVREKRGVIGRFFLRYIRSRTSTVNS